MSSAAFDGTALRRAAVAPSDGAIITQDLTGTIPSWNPSAGQIFVRCVTGTIEQSTRRIVAECVSPQAGHGA